MQAVRSWTRGNSGLGETAGTAGEDSTSPALEVVNVTTFERARRQAAGNYADRLFEGRLIAYVRLTLFESLRAEFGNSAYCVFAAGCPAWAAANAG